MQQRMRSSVGGRASKVLVLLVLALVSLASATEGGEGATASEATAPENATASKPPVVVDPSFDAANENWGTYYDPQNIFCGKYDCYKILGFDYESFGKNHPDKPVITKRYRALSREWHPDKSKHRDAKNRFVKISRAYEVLTSKKTRDEYDFLRYNQEAYFNKYGTSVLWSYAPQSDLWSVVILILIVSNIISWFMQKHRWQMVADRLIKAAAEDWNPSQGGSPESKQLREQALTVLGEQETPEVDPAANSKKKGTKKVSARDKKRMEQEALFPIIKALVNDMHDFGAGFHKPTWRDLLIVSMLKFPFVLASGIAWDTKYYLRRLQKKELSEEERDVLTKRAVGPVCWSTASDEDRQVMIKRELWVLTNLADWNEEVEVKKLPAGEQKMYFKLKKKGKLDSFNKEFNNKEE